MKSLLAILAFLPLFAAAQNAQSNYRAVLSGWRCDTIEIRAYDPETNTISQAWMIECGFECLQSTDASIAKPGDRFVGQDMRIFISQNGDPMRPPFAYCRKK